MTATDLIEVILKVTKNNYSRLFGESDLKRYVNSSISFIEKDKEFKSLISSTEKDAALKLEKLSKELSELKKDFEYFSKLEQKEYKNPMDTIAYLILKYKNKILANDQNQIDVNTFLGYDFFINGIDYYELIRKLEYNTESIEEETSRKKVFYNRKTNFEKLKIILKVLSMLSMLNKENDKSKIKKVILLNKITADMNDAFKYNRRARKTDLFDTLYGYDNLKSVKLMDDENGLKALEEITDSNGVFKDFTNDEIARLLYSFFILYGNAKEITSNTDDFSFKDISEIADVIKRRTIDGIDASKTIDDIASGKIKMHFNEQTSKHI